MAKMTAKERKQAEDLEKVLAQNLDEVQAALKADAEECEKSIADSEAAAIKSIAESGSGDQRMGTRRAIYALREAGGHRISDAVHGRKE